MAVAMISRRTLSIAALAGVAESLIGGGAKAKVSPPRVVAQRLDRTAIVSANLDRLARFYTAIGFVVDDARPAPEQAVLARASSATSRFMRLGQQITELVAFNPPGAAYPRPGESSDPWFQHISLVAPDMGAAFARLSAAEGWSPISRRGPVELSPVLMAKDHLHFTITGYKKSAAAFLDTLIPVIDKVRSRSNAVSNN